MSTHTSSIDQQQHLLEAFAALSEQLGDLVTTGLTHREHHASGESHHPPALPDIVCFPSTTEEVSEIFKISARFQLPVIPFGAGTSVEGQVNALHGGISIDLREMNKILRTSVEDLDVTVQAGVTRLQLCRSLKNTGVTFFIDPGADATIGGMAATRASGTTAVRYGTMRENVLGLTVVLADGRIIKTGSRARKSSPGDGNFHVLCVLNPENPAEYLEAEALSERIVHRAQEAGGTCSGEHGIGYGKLKHLQAEHGAALDVMHSIKQALDPDNRMNPGKMIVLV